MFKVIVWAICCFSFFFSCFKTCRFSQSRQNSTISESRCSANLRTNLHVYSIRSSSERSFGFQKSLNKRELRKVKKLKSIFYRLGLSSSVSAFEKVARMVNRISVFIILMAAEILMWVWREKMLYILFNRVFLCGGKRH